MCFRAARENLVPFLLLKYLISLNNLKVRFGISVFTILLVLSLGCQGCGQKGGKQSLQGAVLILLDTVRADHLSGYGYVRPTSPHIDSLASQGVLFTQVVSNSPWTLPSVVSLLTGEYPERVLTKKISQSLVELFERRGFQTAAFTEGGFVSRAFGLDRGFLYYYEEEGAVQRLNAEKNYDPSKKGGIENTFEKAGAWLKNHKDEPFFLFIHTYEPHTPYTNRDFVQNMDPGQVGPEFTIDLLKELQSGRMTLSASERDYTKALFDGDILNSDRHVGRFVHLLNDLGLDRKTLLVVTSDHGEELGEHFPGHIADHGHSLKDSQLLIPLVIYDPSRKFPMQEVSSQVRLMDVLPTVADLLGVSLLSPVEGKSLKPMMEGKEKEDRAAFSGHTKTGPRRISLRHKGYKYIEVSGPDQGPFPLRPYPPLRQLYDLKEDPYEKKNLVKEKPKMARELKEVLTNWQKNLGKKKIKVPQDIDPGVLERLQSLGYMQ